ncbi:MAG: type II toxin-antitoxin system prevent-host-death family antitoxin [Desulfuromonadaceae bacterium]|nr:type II toxin-antitoxin system prevent-host-death family antitoxin [Desulfuromonadaceae bacterium]
MQAIYATSTVSISDLKKNPSDIINQAHGAPVAILNHNRPTAYLVPAAAYEAMMEQLDDQYLVQLVKERQHERSVRVSLDEL